MPRARKTMDIVSKDLYEWNGLIKGADVVVAGHNKSYSFTFWSMTPDEDGNPKSICVLGGTGGYRQFRHFLPEKVSAKPLPKPKKPRSRNVSKKKAA